MMLSESAYNRITNFYYRLTASEELINMVEEELLQAMWDSDEQISEDELVELAFEIIRKTANNN